MLLNKSKIRIDGYSQDELVQLTDLESFAVAGRPIVFMVGVAEVLAEFSIQERILTVEIAVVENGGAGVLPALINVVEKSAAQRQIIAIEWHVYARNCAIPNPKLERVLEILDFEIRKPSTGTEYYRRRAIN